MTTHTVEGLPERMEGIRYTALLTQDQARI